MTRRATGAVLALAAALTAAGVPGRAPAAEPAVAAPAARDVCRRVGLRTRDGLAIRGVEDMALVSANGERLVLSAYDRSADADAAAGSAGLFALPVESLAALGDAEELPALRRLSDAFQAEQALFPHGIGVRDRPGGGHRLAVVNRRRGGRGGRSTVIELFDLSEAGLEHRGTVHDPRLCRANDVLPAGDGGVLATLDGRACQGFDRAIELVLAPRRGRVVHVAPPDAADPLADTVRVLADGLAFANGIAVDGDRLVVAQTRAAGVVHGPPPAEVPDAGGDAPAGAEARAWTAIPLDGGPDNLGVARGGGVLATVHESLLGLAIHRMPRLGAVVERVLGRALGAWHVSHVDPAGGATRKVLRDADPPVFPAATVALETRAGLVLGSVTEPGLLWCPGLSARPAS